MADNSVEKLARGFIRVGWLGMWGQLILAIIPFFMLGYLIVRKTTGQQMTFQFTDLVALAGLLILFFTTFWSWRYTRLGKRMLEPERRPTLDKAARVLWVGLWAGVLGVVMSLLLLISSAFRLLFLFMKAPQGGVPVIQTAATDRTYWVSALDVVSLLAELCTLAGELMVLGLTLWLLFRLTKVASVRDGAALPEASPVS
jgi:cytochrome b561